MRPAHIRRRHPVTGLGPHHLTDTQQSGTGRVRAPGAGSQSGSAGDWASTPLPTHGSERVPFSQLLHDGELHSDDQGEHTTAHADVLQRHEHQPVPVGHRDRPAGPGIKPRARAIEPPTQYPRRHTSNEQSYYRARVAGAAAEITLAEAQHDSDRGSPQGPQGEQRYRENSPPSPDDHIVPFDRTCASCSRVKEHEECASAVQRRPCFDVEACRPPSTATRRPPGRGLDRKCPQRPHHRHRATVADAALSLSPLAWRDR